VEQREFRTALQDIALVLMAPGRDEEFGQMLEEFRAAGELDVYQGDLAIAWKGYAPFFALVSRMKEGGYPRPGIVPMDSYFIEADGRILGELYIRHRLSPRLEQVGATWATKSGRRAAIAAWPRLR
jgi:predicted acetyltransferase